VSAAPPQIAARALGRRFGPARVFEHATFAVPPGARVAVTGPNGAGKSTLLAVLATLLAPSAGEAWIAGFPVSRGGAPLRRLLGVLAHRPMLYEELTPLENLRFFARLYGVPDAEPRCADLLRTAGLWRRRDDPTAVLSRGLHQRLAIARALVHRPTVLLLDEPETGLDADGLALLDELMLAAPGVTVLAATHRLERVARWADGSLHCERGRIEPSGSARAEETPAPAAMHKPDAVLA
jgi:heme exporter protein A